MSTFLDIQNNAITERFDATVYRARIKDWINEGYRMAYRRLELPTQVYSTSVSTTAGVGSVTLPTTLENILQVANTDGTGVLGEVPYEDVLASYGVDIGRPEEWAVGGAVPALYFFPMPDAAYTYTVVYEGLPAALSADTDVPALPSDYHDMLTAYAISRGYRSEDDPEAAAAWMNDYELMLQRLGADLRHLGDSSPRQVPGMWELGGFRG